MKTIEDRLQEHNEALKIVRAPSALEGRLRHALAQVPSKKRKTNKAVAWVVSLAAAFLLIVGTYQFPAFAYYGGKLLSQMELDSLKFAEVAQHGYGQAVNKSKTFDDGTVIAINGVIADDNALTLYYSIDRPNGSLVDEKGSNRFFAHKLQGFLTHSNARGGSGNYSNGKSHYEGVAKFDAVSPFSRTLTVTFGEWIGNKENAYYPVTFKFDANKAMNSLFKADIEASVAVDEGAVVYDSITASPTSTIVKGHYELNEKVVPRFPGNTALYVNGTRMKPWLMLGANPTEEGGFPGFELEFDVLPTDKITSVELVLEDFNGYQKVDQPISLAAPSDKSITIGDEKLWIRSVTKTDTGYDIVIARKQFTFVETDDLAVQTGETEVPVSSISPERQWDLHNGNILWEQTYSFNTLERPERLLLSGFHYIKTYGKTVPIPITAPK
ncbi:DUF4179 domain-containing protein [Paenibacillus sp. MMS18-CY102]|uniref:DUF4179 domain-containing protein n=1 Tax=Paenibacillus sp. MMS18-CY102 TaxID=2682849 RepID=UPI0013659A8B|nr:DUF4179 domain-containing protein [Paenibacillus sp. MMS18-CY102]MWC30642.1 DUF4179 domain-containing protein [Paenibacillus sp. MMS18-CY102]